MTDFAIAVVQMKAPDADNVDAMVQRIDKVMRLYPWVQMVLFSELAKTTGGDPRLDAHVDSLKPQLDDYDTMQYRARKIAEDISLALQGSLLVRYGHPAVTEAFLATRLGGDWGSAYGTLPIGLDVAPILERALVTR